MSRTLWFFCLLLCNLFTASSFAQVVDANFNPKILAQGRVYAAAMQSDGKIVATGRFSKYNGTDAPGIVRLNSDGTVDNTFLVGTGPQGGIIAHIAIQTDGKILVFGSFTTFNGKPHKLAVRLLTDGSVDESFNLASNVSDGTDALTGVLLLLPDGSIITMRGIQVSGVYYNELMKIKTDGSRDNTFTATVKGLVYDLKLWMGDKILVAGSFTECNSTPVGNFVRLKADGTIDSTYGTGADNWIGHILVQSTNKIVLAGELYKFNGTPRGATVRLNLDGTVDTGFGGTGTRVDAFIQDASDNIYVGRGDFNEIQKLNANGTITNTYTTLATTQLMLQSDGKLVGLGYTQPSNQLAIRLNTNFTKDNTFQSLAGPRAKGRIDGMDTQPDGKIIIIGDFVTFGGYDRAGIVRLNADLTVDGNFLMGKGFEITSNSLFFDFVKCQSDGKIIVGGSFSSYNGVAQSNSIVRLNSDGVLDNSFAAKVPTFFNSAVMFNDTLYMASSYPPYLTRVNANGVTDATFKPVIDKDVYSCQVQADGKVLIFGTFKSVNGKAITKAARLNANGSNDDSFKDISASVYSITRGLYYGENKIVLGGTFPSPADPSNYVSFIAVDGTGTVRSDFVVPPTTSDVSSGYIFKMKDNSLLVTAKSGLNRMLPSGKFDTGFSELTLRDNYPYYLEVLPLTATSFLYSGQSDTEARIFHVTVTPIPPPPAAPTFTKLTSALSGAPELTWQDNSIDETRFLVERAGDDGVFVEIGTTAANAVTYKDGKAASNTVYQYRVASTNDYGTSYSSAKTLETGIVTGVEAALAEKIYPNPSKGLFHVNFQNEAHRTLRVVSLGGNVVQELSVASDDVTMDLSSEPAGIYCIQIAEGSSLRNIKVVKY